MIRKATEHDLSAIKDIYNYAVLNTTATYDINPRDDKYFANMLSEHTGKYLLAVYEDNGDIIGYVALSQFSRRDAYDITAELSVYVKADCQNKHIGTQLMEYALSYAQTENRFLTIVSLITSDNEHSIYLHRKFGFEFGGKIKNAGFKFNRMLGVDIYYKNL
ncbi:N-acetyltransferase [Eubacterium sp. OM08-24]|jgi:L-amino acid N-acyltransferase YncA|uniref:GNAT family N-acetyltransferase n=1 Tax=Eubacterium sp. OM08-24 TaxID=2292352 RepID=UPI000E44BCFF|nr:GNAT family N-acetyltransferase [Eubacterium sp. OM08-24]RGM17999.1 N-acetyltransferase [Eubacterium sp. OM08-24]